MILTLLSKELRNLADRIDSGNTYLTEEEQMEIIQFVKGFEKDKPMSKYQAFNYLHISRATFDNLVKEGKIPQGQKQQGFNELQWFQKDLDAYRKANKTSK